MRTETGHISLAPLARAVEVPSRVKAVVRRLKHLLGIDRAVAFTVLARTIQIVGSGGTVLLILHCLTAEEQGYYYTLLSLVSLQVVFELGFSFVVLQMAAHECAHLIFHSDGRIEGSAVSHTRLASILQKLSRWYLALASILWISLLFVGVLFFSGQGRTTSLIAWQGPWAVAVSATAVLFFLNPFFSFLEGCGLVWQVGRMRLGQAVAAAALSWAALLSHQGLYSPGMVIIGYVVVGTGFLWTQRSLLGRLLRRPADEAAISWRTEVWPFQWKIAVSWLCAYLAIQIFTPVLFAYRGAVEAGRLGMSLSITGYLSTLALAWMSTKATPFGRMIARADFQQLRRLFSRTLHQGLALLLVLAGLCQAAAVALHYRSPRLSARIVSPTIFLLLLLTGISAFIVQSMGIYLRSFKREPFLVQSVVIAALSIVLSLSTVKGFGATGIALGYFLCTGIVGIISAVTVFRSWHAAIEKSFVTGG